MIKFEPQFVTVDDFNNYHNANLRDMLRSYTGDDSYSAENFLFKTEWQLMQWIDNTTYRMRDWYHLNPKQKMLFQLAILEQAMYRFKSGDIGLDSGYDPEKGPVANRGYLNRIRVSQTAIDYLSNAGLYNMIIKNRPRTFSGGTYLTGFTDGSLPGPAPAPGPAPEPQPQPTPGGNVMLGIGWTEND